jgi:hypothetical protein
MMLFNIARRTQDDNQASREIHNDDSADFLLMLAGF